MAVFSQSSYLAHSSFQENPENGIKILDNGKHFLKCCLWTPGSERSKAFIRSFMKTVTSLFHCVAMCTEEAKAVECESEEP